MQSLFKRTATKENSDSDDSDSDETLVNQKHDWLQVQFADEKEDDLLETNEDDSSLSGSSYIDSSTDEGQYRETVSLRELILNIAQMSLYALDVISDSFLAISYTIQSQYTYAVLTLAVVYIASGIDAYFNRSELKRENPNYKYRYILTLLFNVRGLDVYKNLVWLKLELYRGIHPMKETQEDFFDRNFRVANLKTHEGLFEACPQLLLQLYIMLATIEDEAGITLALQIISVFISLCSLAMTFITGDKARRLYEHECDKFSHWGLALQFFWIFPVTASRILALSCVTSIYPIMSTSCFGIHGFVTFIYLRLTQPYTSFGALVAAIRIFLTPYEPIEEYDDEVTQRLLHSHLIHFVGSLSAICIWATSVDIIKIGFSMYVSIIFLFGFGFVLGVISLVILLKYKKDCFIQDGEKESEMDRRMQPYVNLVKGIVSRIGGVCIRNERRTRNLITKPEKQA